jgi:hypothetical protein
MGLRRERAEMECVGDLEVGQAGGDEREHLMLACGELVKTGGDCGWSGDIGEGGDEPQNCGVRDTLSPVPYRPLGRRK